jgi:hypothetical protein
VDGFSRGVFARRFALSLVFLLVFVAAAFAAGDHGHGTLMNLLGIPTILAGVSALYALIGVVYPPAGRWIDKNQQ